MRTGSLVLPAVLAAVVLFSTPCSAGLAQSKVQMVRSDIMQSAFAVSTLIDKIVSEAARAALSIENLLSSGFRDTSLHLDYLSYYIVNGLPSLTDLRPDRDSEFFVSYMALQTDPSPPLAATGATATNCTCESEWEALKTKMSPHLLAGKPNITCMRACELLLGYQVTARMDPMLKSYTEELSFITNWYFTRGNGTLSEDWGRLWYTGSNDTTLSLVSLNTTGTALLNASGNPICYIVYPRQEAFDRTPGWTTPYIDAVSKLPVITLGTPTYTEDGEFLGGFYGDLVLSTSGSIFQNSTNASYGMLTILVTSAGDVAAASPGAIDLLFQRECADKQTCNLMSYKSIAQVLWKNTTDDVDGGDVRYIELDGVDYVMFDVDVTYEFSVLFFIPKSNLAAVSYTTTIVLAVVLPCAFVIALFIPSMWLFTRRMRSTMADLENKIGNAVTSSNTLGTAAEDVIKFLLRIKSRSSLNRIEKGELVKIISLIASNKLFRTEAALRQKLEVLQLDKDVDAYLLDFLAKKDSDGATSSQQGQSDANSTTLKGPQSSANSMDSGGVSSSACTSVVAADEIVDLDTETLAEVILPNGHIVRATDWDFDVEMMPVPSGCSLLEAIAMIALDTHDLMDAFSLNRRKVLTFVRTIERGYNKPPYHTSVHAADVTQAMLSLVTGCTDIHFSPLEKLASVIAPIVHDYGHQGLNNNFLQATMDAIFVKFNGVSVLESMHASESMKVLLCSETNFLSHKMAKDEIVDLHKLVTQLVLATDMSRHLEITSQFSARCTAGTLGTSKQDRLLVLQMLLKMADVSNPARQWEVCKRWTERVMEEFFRQGDKEAALKLQISPFMDRNTTDVSKCQGAFIQYVVQPMAEMVSRVNPSVKETLQANLIRNAASWRSLSSSAMTESRR